jgi:hypothetical protein
MTSNNPPKIIITHDYIRVVFGNNRGLSVSYSAEKASGAVPGNVFDLWSKSHRSDEAALARIGLKKGANHQEITEAFVKHIDTIWPEWNVGPKVPAVGATVTVNFGKRKGVDTGVVQKVKGTQVSILFEREGLVRMAADML